MSYGKKMEENYNFLLASLKDALGNMPNKTDVPASDMLAVAACTLAHADWSKSEFRMVLIREMINQALEKGYSSLVEAHFSDDKLGSDVDWGKV